MADEHSELRQMLSAAHCVSWQGGRAVAPIGKRTVGLEANRSYFNNPTWASSYLRFVHRSTHFRARWLAATGSWQDKIVVDVGCGPGNVAACLKQNSRALIGIDVSEGALDLAAKQGYETLLADAQNLPLKTGCADIVIVNATLHHCDDMICALKEAARLVSPGGVLVTDHDPQKSSFNFKGLGLLAWNLRVHLYRLLRKGFHRSVEEQEAVLASEIHHNPGDGVTREMFTAILEPMGFEVKIYTHNSKVGAEVFAGKRGRIPLKYRLNQMLSGIKPFGSDAAILLMCVAHRKA